jgi:hypothetical protein
LRFLTILSPTKIMRSLYAIRQLAIIGLLFLQSYSLGLAAAELRGRVTNAETGASQPHAGLIYLRPTDAFDLEFLVEVTDDLGNWLGGEAAIELVSATDNGDGSETVVVRDKIPLADVGRFLRLTVNRLSE